NTNSITQQERDAITGFAKMIQGYQYMIPANFVYDNGIRVDVSDPYNPGPYVPYAQAMDHVRSLLVEADQSYSSAGNGSFPLRLTPGFNQFNTIPALRQVNSAILARANAYRKDWDGV